MAEHREDPDLFWIDPRARGILPLDGFHISRSLARRMRLQAHRVTLNADFAGVLDGCANREETWISDKLRALYLELHVMGDAHSLEIWQEGALAGGVYGVAIGGGFFGESMFSRRRDGSKLALAHLTDHLRRCGFTLFDTQFITPHLASLGAVEIARAAYHMALKQALKRDARIDSLPLADAQAVLQRNTQTS